MNEEKLAKRYIERFKKHEPLYNLLREEGNDVYESVKHCYRVEINEIGCDLIAKLSLNNKKKRIMSQIITPFSEAMLSLEELVDLNYQEIKEEMRKEMVKI